MDVKLIVINGKANRKEIPIKLPLTIGRGKEAGLTVAHPTVSRIHCELYELDGALVVRDNGSTNGIYVGEDQVLEAVLRPGDELTVGPLTFRAIYDHPSDDYPEVGGEDADTEEAASGMDFLGSLNVGGPATEPEAPNFEAADAGEASDSEDLEATAQFGSAAAEAIREAAEKEDADRSETFSNDEVEELEFELTSGASETSEEEATEEPEEEAAESDESAGEAEFDFLAEDTPAKKTPAGKAPSAPKEPTISPKAGSKSAKPDKSAKKGWWPFGGKKGEKSAAKTPTPSGKPGKKVEPVIAEESETSEPEEVEEMVDFEANEAAEAQAPEASAEDEPASNDDDLNDFFNQMGLK